MTDELEQRREANEVVRHDMRTRVGIGKGYIAMLLNHYDAMTPAQRASALQGLSDAFDRLDEFTRRVLMDEKLEVFGAQPQRGEVPVSTLVDAIRAVHPALVVAVADSAPATAYVDPVMVREVLDNLVANARAVAPAGTDVTLRVGGDAETLRFEVHDHGPGVTDEDRKVLFQRYGRTERSRRTHSSGLGLGLSIVRRLVEAHDGGYGVEAGDGTTFWVELPVSPNAVRSPERA